jgi:hypothetical protein
MRDDLDLPGEIYENNDDMGDPDDPKNFPTYDLSSLPDGHPVRNISEKAVAHFVNILETFSHPDFPNERIRKISGICLRALRYGSIRLAIKSSEGPNIGILEGTSDNKGPIIFLSEDFLDHCIRDTFLMSGGIVFVASQVCDLLNKNFSQGSIGELSRDDVVGYRAQAMEAEYVLTIIDQKPEIEEKLGEHQRQVVKACPVGVESLPEDLQFGVEVGPLPGYEGTDKDVRFWAIQFGTPEVNGGHQ